MNNRLRTLMAEMESWEAAAEFGIPKENWAEYQVRERVDDLYIACLTHIFDALRLKDINIQEKELADLAKTLVIFSKSAAAKYLTGVERSLNLLYCAALYYLAGFPATATLLARKLDAIDMPLTEELFLHAFLKRRLNKDNQLDMMLEVTIQSESMDGINELITFLNKQINLGLESDPRKFIAAKLSFACIERFKNFNIFDSLQNYASNYSREQWQPFFSEQTLTPIWELLQSQLVAIKAGILGEQNETFSLQMPTSAGKTSLCELIIYHEVKIRKKKVLFLVPFRALAAEIREGMSKRLDIAGVKIIASHGGNIPTRSDATTVESSDVLIITPEKFMAMAQIIPDLESNYQSIICDEGHLIDDESRGLQYELLLTKLRGTEATPKKIIFISAILPNVNEIHEWLGGKPEHLAQSDYRPVETDYAFLVTQSSQQDSWKLDVNPIYKRPRSYFLVNFLVKNDFRYLNPATDRLKLIPNWDNETSLACAAALKARRNGAVALFTTQRNFINHLANKLITLFELDSLVSQNSPSLSDKLPKLIKYIEFQLGQDYLLSRLLNYGIGFHHGKLPQEIRREMEEAIQNKIINVLLCTSTLAEGVNLPIRTLIVHTIKRYAGEKLGMQPILKRSIKNIIGRVGRAGKETRGRVIFINQSERELLKVVLLDKEMEVARGALYEIIATISRYVEQHRISLNNELIDNITDPVFLSIIDNIDFTLLDLIPVGTPQGEINRHIDELLSRTLANRYCDTPQLQDCIKTIFRLRAEKAQLTVDPGIWPTLQKTGTSLRFWSFIQDSKLLEHPLWLTLSEPLDKEWLEAVVIKLLDYPAIGIETSPPILTKVIYDWMSGKTYSEIANNCNLSIDETLEILSTQIGYRLQEQLAKLIQLAVVHYGENIISNMARNWASLLQFGLLTIQQLDIFDRGASDRLAVWGVSRYLSDNKIELVNKQLIQYLRDNNNKVRSYLNNDVRIPSLSMDRICSELKI